MNKHGFYRLVLIPAMALAMGASGCLKVTAIDSGGGGGGGGSSSGAAAAAADIAPVLDAIADQASAVEGTAITTVNAADAADDFDADLQAITYECWYDTTANAAVTETTLCTALTGVSFTAATGVLDWTPNIIHVSTKGKCPIVITTRLCPIE